MLLLFSLQNKSAVSRFYPDFIYMYSSKNCVSGSQRLAALSSLIPRPIARYPSEIAYIHVVFLYRDALNA